VLSVLNEHKIKLIKSLALIGSIATVAQIIVNLISGSSFCLSDSCEVVEGLTIISPFYLNMLGLLFFQAVFWGFRFTKRKSFNEFDPLGLILISGLAFESVLISYQVFVTHTLCVYCILIFIIVFFLNLMNSRRQIVTGVALSSAIAFSFSILIFTPSGALSKSYSLKAAAYAVKSCSNPTKEVYLIFSTDCPHCHNVINILNNCNSCEFYLNPIDEVGSFEFNDLKRIPTFSPNINRQVLSVLGIESIPVLVVKSAEGYRFIRGEKPIIDYVQHACFTDDEVLYLEKSFLSGEESITLLKDDTSECSIEIDCEQQQ
jgi:hypothetical protein